MEDIVISIATKNDREQLLDWFSFYPNEKLIERRVDCYLEHYFTILARENNRIAGVLQWYVKENPAHGLAEIEEVLIHEKYRGQGIGSSLVTFAVAAIRDYFAMNNIRPRKVYLFVGKENKPARKLYEKHGFALINSIGNLFNDTKEELFYSLDL